MHLLQNTLVRKKIENKEAYFWCMGRHKRVLARAVSRLVGSGSWYHSGGVDGLGVIHTTQTASKRIQAYIWCRHSGGTVIGS